MSSSKTPMMLQYYKLKKKQLDKFLFFRLGDFYELFEDDAIKASKMLSLLLTKRNGIPMCGFPHHQLNNYAHKIIKNGGKIAIAEQNTDLDENQKIITREITKIISPGMLLDENILTTEQNNFIAFIYFFKNDKKNNQCDLLLMDISTGEVFFSTISRDLINTLNSQLLNYSPREIIFWEGNFNPQLQIQVKSNYPELLLSSVGDVFLESSEWKEVLVKIFPSGFQVMAENEKIFQLLGQFVKENNYMDLLNLKKPILVNWEKYLILDHIALKHLEIFENQFSELKKHTLYNTINYTLTPMGARLFKNNLLKPLKSRKEIEGRLDCVSEFKKNPTGLLHVRNRLKNMFDLERTNVKIQNNSIRPKELLNLAKNLSLIQEIFFILKKELSQVLTSSLFKNILIDFEIVHEIISEIMFKILSDPQNNLNEGKVINPECDEELKKNNYLRVNSLTLLSQLESKVRSITRINTLKIKYNSNYGFFFEVSKNQANNVPSEFIKKQSLINAERFVNQELIELESKIINIKNVVIQREVIIYSQLVKKIKAEKKLFENLVFWVAQIDFFASLAFLANQKNYRRPTFNEKKKMTIISGKHPIVENESSMGEFIPNSLIMNNDNFFHLITGPNMSGKSTFLRQNALLILLAQMGSFLPVESAELPIFDRIFTRIGSGDKIAKGESTFMVEMKEVANILNNCTNDSFVIMDEIGRGTSTYDGLAIAWSIIKYFIDLKFIRAKTLFATHYHELGKLSAQGNSLENYNVAVKESADKVIFLKKVVKGLANKSYGVYVAELAGLPKEIINEAKLMLNQFINEKKLEIGFSLEKSKKEEQEEVNKKKLNEEKLNQVITQKIKKVDIDDLTPLSALNFLSELKNRLEKDE